MIARRLPRFLAPAVVAASGVSASVLASAIPSVSADPCPDVQVVFARGTDNALWHRWQTAPNNGWSGWSSLGGRILEHATVLNNKDGRFEVLARGLDTALWHRWQTAPSNGWN